MSLPKKQSTPAQAAGTNSKLLLAWCSYEAAKYAVQKWHYSKCMPSGKSIRIGVWENDQFIGCVIFGRGANRNTAARFKLGQAELCELVRVALKKHETPVSRIVAIAVRMLKKKCPKLKMLFSYADPNHGHHGGIYQAMNWIYIGHSTPQSAVAINGVVHHKRSVSAKFGTASVKVLRERGIKAERSDITFKHTFVLPIDQSLIQSLRELGKPYPKKETTSAGSIAGDAPTSGGEKAVRSRPLRSKNKSAKRNT